MAVPGRACFPALDSAAEKFAAVFLPGGTRKRASFGVRELRGAIVLQGVEPPFLALHAANLRAIDQDFEGVSLASYLCLADLLGSCAGQCCDGCAVQPLRFDFHQPRPNLGPPVWALPGDGVGRFEFGRAAFAGL